jgi:putative flippase GtrA
VNRETITYAIAGVMTTVVNFVTYHLFCNIIGVENLIANGIAWVVAVIFAYIINDLWVFQSIRGNLRGELEKVAKFFSARVLSFVVEEAGMFLFVDILALNNLIVKAGLAIIVIILNYFFSKLYIFNKKQ